MLMHRFVFFHIFLHLLLSSLFLWLCLFVLGGKQFFPAFSSSFSAFTYTHSTHRLRSIQPYSVLFLRCAKVYVVWYSIEAVNCWSLTTLSNALEISAAQWTIKRLLICTSSSTYSFSSSDSAINTLYVYRFHTSWPSCVTIVCNYHWLAGGQLTVLYWLLLSVKCVHMKPSLSASRIRQKPKGNIHTSGLMTIYIIDNTHTLTHTFRHMGNYVVTTVIKVWNVNTHSAFLEWPHSFGMPCTTTNGAFLLEHKQHGEDIFFVLPLNGLTPKWWRIQLFWLHFDIWALHVHATIFQIS